MAPTRERKRPPPAKVSHMTCLALRPVAYMYHPQLYREDIVQHVGNPEQYGLVARCWQDAEEDMPHGPDEADPLNRALKHGEVGVSWFPLGTREILPEGDFRLVDRTFQPGDFCKRAVEDVFSGVVTSIEVKGRLVHSISGEEVEGWRSMSELETAADIFVGDYVACDDWVGQVRSRCHSAHSSTLIGLPYNRLLRYADIARLRARLFMLRQDIRRVTGSSVQRPACPPP
jgi:hypothetical protein